MRVVEQELAKNLIKPEPEVNTMSGDDIIKQLSGKAEEQPEVPQEVNDDNAPDYSKLSVEDLRQKAIDNEFKRRGFHRELELERKHNEELKAILSRVNTQVHTNNQPQTALVAKQELNEPDVQDFLKGVDEEDPKALMVAQAKYNKAVLSHQMELERRKTLEELNRREEEKAVMENARKLAAKDARFQNADGSPNINAIQGWMSNIASDWSALYDAFNAKTEEAKPKVVQQPQQQNSFPRSASSAPASTEPNKPKLPKGISELARNTPSGFQLPPGCEVVI